jgi:hypothetical protein
MARIKRKQYHKDVFTWKLKNVEESMGQYQGGSDDSKTERFESISSCSTVGEALAFLKDSRAKIASNSPVLCQEMCLSCTPTNKFTTIDLTENPSESNDDNKLKLVTVTPSTFTNGREFNVSSFEHIHPLFKSEKTAASPFLPRCAESQPYMTSMRSQSYFNRSIPTHHVQPFSFAASIPKLPFVAHASMIEHNHNMQNTVIYRQDPVVPSMNTNGHNFHHSLLSIDGEMAYSNSTDLAHQLPIEEIKRFFGID